MTESAGAPPTPLLRPTLRRRITAVPRRARLVAALLGACALVPPSAQLWAYLSRGRLAHALDAHPGLASIVALAMAVAALVAARPPRTRSLVRYLAQLRAEFLEMQSTFDGALRRRAHEEENHDAAAHSRSR